MLLPDAAYFECGNHGECDHRTGKCECVHGFHGEACSDTADDKVRVIHTNHQDLQ